MIKFRAWDKTDKKMISWKQMRSEFTFEYFEDENLVFMQSTGLFDKNGQEIFEGDLLDTSDPTGNIISSGNPILEVRFNGLEFTVKGDIENGEMSLREFKEICEYAGIPLKVIGNVYENRDLLEVSNDTEI